MDVFVYGTLTDPDRAGEVLSAVEYAGAATLEGLHRVDGHYPTLAPGGTVEGRILVTEETDALDRYEGVDRDLYVRTTLPTADGDAVETYVGHPDKLGAAASWPGEGPLESRVAAYVADHDVVVRRSFK